MVKIFTGESTLGFSDHELYDQYMAEQKKKHDRTKQDTAPGNTTSVRKLSYTFQDLTMADYEAAQILVNMSSSSSHQLEAAQTMVAMSQSSGAASARAPAPTPVSAFNVTASVLGNPKISVRKYHLWKASGVKKYSEYLAWKEDYMDVDLPELPHVKDLQSGACDDAFYKKKDKKGREERRLFRKTKVAYWNSHLLQA